MASEYYNRLQLKNWPFLSFYSTALTVKQLKELCRKHGLKVTGAKATLILQLENVDRMSQEARGGDARSVFIYFGGHVISE
jgi:hypothetical protein